MLINRVGTFFILLGITLIALFILSDMAKSPTYGLLVFGFVSLGLGIFMWFRDPPPPKEPTGRFRILKTMNKKPVKK